MSQSPLSFLPAELRAKVWFWVFADEMSYYGWYEDSLSSYPVAILLTCRMFRDESQKALRQHFSEKCLSYNEQHPPQEMEEEEEFDFEGSRLHIRFLRQYGACFKDVNIYSVENAGDHIGIAHFPNLETLEFVEPFIFRLEESQILTGGQGDPDLLANIWTAWYKRQVDEEGEEDRNLFEGLLTTYARIMQMKKGQERGFNIRVNLSVHVKTLKTKSLTFNTDQKQIVSYT